MSPAQRVELDRIIAVYGPESQPAAMAAMLLSFDARLERLERFTLPRDTSTDDIS